ncbi:MAG: hypothetical protein MN733_38455 [Nitrososphaera sp.]|nr:hypothetical protein [Nitrososphaera sp.]
MTDTPEGDRAIDVRIAREIFNKKPCHFTIDGIFSIWATCWKCRCQDSENCYPENQDAIEHGHSPLRRYSEQLDAGWEVLLSPSSKFSIWRSLSSCPGEDFKLCLDYPERNTYWLEYMTPGGLKKGPEAKSPAMAICLAALECVKA